MSMTDKFTEFMREFERTNAEFDKFFLRNAYLTLGANTFFAAACSIRAAASRTLQA